MAQVHDTATDDAGAWVELEDRLLSWKEPTELVGIYRGAETVVGKYGSKRRHTVEAEAGVVSFFAPAMLDRMLTNVRHGERIRIRYAGQTVLSSGGQHVKKFTIQRWERPAAANGPADEDAVPF
jgi:hypothetical protein